MIEAQEHIYAKLGLTAKRLEASDLRMMYKRSDRCGYAAVQPDKILGKYLQDRVHRAVRQSPVNNTRSVFGVATRLHDSEDARAVRQSPVNDTHSVFGVASRLHDSEDGRAVRQSTNNDA